MQNSGDGKAQGSSRDDARLLAAAKKEASILGGRASRSLPPRTSQDVPTSAENTISQEKDAKNSILRSASRGVPTLGISTQGPIYNWTPEQAEKELANRTIAQDEDLGLAAKAKLVTKATARGGITTASLSVAQQSNNPDTDIGVSGTVSAGVSGAGPYVGVSFSTANESSVAMNATAGYGHTGPYAETGATVSCATGAENIEGMQANFKEGTKVAQNLTEGAVRAAKNMVSNVVGNISNASTSELGNLSTGTSQKSEEKVQQEAQTKAEPKRT